MIGDLLIVIETLGGICDTGEKVDDDRNLKGKIEFPAVFHVCVFSDALLFSLSLSVLLLNILVTGQERAGFLSLLLSGRFFLLVFLKIKIKIKM